MPVAITELPAIPPPPQPPRKKWTREECQALEAAGLLDGPSFELVDGELINTMGKNRPHSNGTYRLYRRLVEIFGWDYVQQEASIDVAGEDNSTNEPEPDLIVLSRRIDELEVINPGPADLRLVVEVADTSLSYDRTVKARLYARAGIADYWVMDLNGRQLIVHREPSQGRYLSVTAYSEKERVAPLAAPDSYCQISTLLSQGS